MLLEQIALGADCPDVLGELAAEYQWKDAVVHREAGAEGIGHFDLPGLGAVCIGPGPAAEFTAQCAVARAPLGRRP